MRKYVESFRYNIPKYCCDCAYFWRTAKTPHSPSLVGRRVGIPPCIFEYFYVFAQSLQSLGLNTPFLCWDVYNGCYMRCYFSCKYLCFKNILYDVNASSAKFVLYYWVSVEEISCFFIMWLSEWLLYVLKIDSDFYFISIPIICRIYILLMKQIWLHLVINIKYLSENW